MNFKHGNVTINNLTPLYQVLHMQKVLLLLNKIDKEVPFKNCPELTMLVM